MKILVGIMYCIENEFSQCIKSIEAQTYKNYDYFVIEKLPNRDAHNKLYQIFMDHSKEYDLFVKLDADMVLSRVTFFEEVVEYFTKHPQTDDLQIAVHDYFTDRLIFGLHVYSARIKWEQNQENIFVDWPEKQESYLRVNDKQCLAPAALHCPHPSNFQAFHFGLHKAVKITQYDRKELRYFGSIVHWDNILLIIKHFKKVRHPAIAYAILGSYESLIMQLSSEHINFDNDITQSIFSAWESHSDSAIISAAERVGFWISLLPDNLVLQIILLRRNLWVGEWKSAIKSFLKNLVHNRLSQYRKNI